MNGDSRQEKKSWFKTFWRLNTIIGVGFILIGVAGLLYGWGKEFPIGGLTWLAAFILIGLYPSLVLSREEQ